MSASRTTCIPHWHAGVTAALLDAANFDRVLGSLHALRGFTEAAAMVEAHGFRPGRHPYDFWIRSR